MAKANDPNAQQDCDQHRRSSEPSRFSLLYESRDGKLCLFMDAEGHLTAVPAAKLV